MNVGDRHDQMFPKLAPGEIDRLRRFGEARYFRASEYLFEAGQAGPGMFVLLTGSAEVTRHDGFGHTVRIVELVAGDFIAEVGELSGRPALVDARALTDLDTILVPPKQLRALLIADVALSERIMRALILRRMLLIEGGAAGPVLIGPANNPDLVRLQEFLARNAYPHRVVDPMEDSDARALVERYAPRPSDLPLAVCVDGSVLKNPSEAELARCLGMVGHDAPDSIYDVAVVGAGPAGLSTAVYAASEGLSVIVCDARAFGGQAGASARIENYLGFPTGISGQALAGRAFVQAQKFGAEMAIPSEAAKLDCTTTPLSLDMADGGRVQARAIVVASGARYRRPDIPHLTDFEGRGVWYWASPIEARLCRSEEVVLVGGGNSAGQAAVYLSEFAAKVWVLVRGEGLAETMSRYLVDRIEAAANIEVLNRTEVVALFGSQDGQLERVRWRRHATGEEVERAIHNVFLFVGADPATEWLRGCGIAMDAKGFIRTGSGPSPGASQASEGAVDKLPLESSLPGVFAVGDVRLGSVKRVGGAIGEGAAVVAQLHSFLARTKAVS